MHFIILHFNATVAIPGLVAMATAFAGMYLGQLLRSRMDADTFRRWFLIAMLLLGIYLAGEMLVRIHG